MDSLCVNVFFLRKRAVAIIRLLQTATVQYDIWWFFDSSPVVFKICAALKWGKKEWREGEELPLSFFPYPSHFFLLSHSHWLHPFWLLGTSQGIRWMLDCARLRIWGRIIHKSPSRLQCQCMRASSQLSASRTNWKAWENTVRKGRYLHILFKCFPRAFQTQMKITGN